MAYKLSGSFDARLVCVPIGGGVGGSGLGLVDRSFIAESETLSPAPYFRGRPRALDGVPSPVVLRLNLEFMFLDIDPLTCGL